MSLLPYADMCYVNSVLVSRYRFSPHTSRVYLLTYCLALQFYRVGGGSRLSGLLLAAATAGVMFAGPSIIGYLRTSIESKVLIAAPC